MVTNREISRLFAVYAELLLLHNSDARLAGLLSGASFRLRNIREEVVSLERLALLKLFKSQIVRVILELSKKGTISSLDELIQLTPPGLFELMRIKGLGGKKLAIIWKIAKIDSMESLLRAAKNDELSAIPGFGAKTQANIISSIEAYSSNKGRFYYSSVADDATTLVEALQTIFKTKLVSLCGEVRRRSTTVNAIEIMLAVSSKKLSKSLFRKFMIIQSSTDKQTTGHTLDEIPVIIYHTTASIFYQDLFRQTGIGNHVKKVWSKINTKGVYKSEKEIYKKAGLTFIEPEMREDNAEWDFIKNKRNLLTPEDIKGVVHNHTTWSDGVDTLEDFVNACKQKNYEYVVISDHSKNAHYAGGLKEEKLFRQLKAIDQLNKKLKPFRIFKSVECDILVSGELDYQPSVLKRLDLVIVSVHQLLKMNEAKATSRLIKAIENPYTTILGHMTGRQLLIRPGYPVNFKKIIDACAANGVVIEVNANPRRLDMDWSHIPYALEKGVMISVNPDAHSIGEIDNIRWGVAAATKGGLTKEMTWNAMGLNEVEKWLKKRYA